MRTLAWVRPTWLDWDHYWNQDPQTLERAFALAQKAIALDDCATLRPHRFEYVYLSTRQPEQAIAEAERAIALDPNNADGHFGLGMILNLRAGRRKPWR